MPKVEMWSELQGIWSIPDFRRLFLARVVSNIGNGMAPIALAFGVLELPGGDAGSLSVVTTFHMIPLVLFMLVGGVAADRFGRARLVGLTDIFGAIFVSLSAFSFLFDFASVPLLAFNGFVFGVLNALWYPAFTGLMPQIVPSEKLQSANSSLGVGANLSYTIGASVAGITVATFGSGWAIMIDAASFAIAGALVFGLRHLDSVAVTDEETEQESMMTQLRDGWVEFSSRQWLVIVVIAYAFFHMAFEGFLGVIAPVQVKEALGGSRDMGIMMAGWGFGSVMGTIAAFRLRPQRALLLAVGVIPVMSFWMFALAVPMPLWFLVFAAFSAGVALDLFYANWITTLQIHIPPEAMSRVGAYDAVGSLAFAPIGLFLAGPLTHVVGAQTALVIAGSIALCAALAPLLSRQVRTLERGNS